MHLKRLITASIALPLLYLYIAKLSAGFFFALLMLVSVFAQIEFYSMYKTKKPLAAAGIIGGIAVFLATFAGSVTALHSAVIFAFMLIASVRLFLIKDPSASLKDISPAVAGFLYIPCLLLAQWHLRLKGYEWIIFLYGCVWASDSLAYYVGKNLGKRKLYEEVSPNKTLEGGFGSIIGGILFAILLGKLMLNNIAIPALIAMGGIIGIITIVGDLVESMFKRDAGVKDSGSIIPGHGGILDKIDGSIFAGPALYWMTLML
jgi:phosphatidate cytidylyltransferase